MPGRIVGFGRDVGIAARLAPLLDDQRHRPRGVVATQQGDESVGSLAGTLGDHLHPTVAQVGGVADQPELQGPGPGPPPEADPLHLAVHEGGQPDRVGHGR